MSVVSLDVTDSSWVAADDASTFVDRPDHRTRARLHGDARCFSSILHNEPIFRQAKTLNPKFK